MAGIPKRIMIFLSAKRPTNDSLNKPLQFSLSSELKGIQLLPHLRVLDAGCGSGVLCRYLESNYQDLSVSGCDLSEESLSYARDKSTKESTRFFKHDIINGKLPADSYDVIFNRLVAHHLGENLSRAYKNFYDGLRPGARLYVIDTDGLFLNLATLSPSLKSKMERVRSAFKGDACAGRQTPPLLNRIGFRQLSWRIETMDFKGENRVKEVQQWKERFDSSLSFYIEVFGSEFETKKFFKEYTTEASNEHVPRFYNKFIVEAVK